MAGLHVAEQGHFPPDLRCQFLFRAADYHGRMNSGLLQHLYRMLCRLGFQFLGCPEVRNESEVDAGEVFFRHFPLELPDGLKERLGLHVTDSATDFRDYDIKLAGLAEEKHSSLDFVGDMRDYLYGRT